MGRYHHPRTTRLGGRHLPGALTQRERRPQGPGDGDASVSPPAASGMESGAGQQGQPIFESGGDTTLLARWPPRLDRACQEGTPIIPSNSRRPHSLHRNLRVVWKSFMAGTSRCLVALWHERRPQMFFHVLDNYFLSLSLPFAFFSPQQQNPRLCPP